MKEALSDAPASRRITLWPRGLVGRVMFVLLAAVALVFVGSSVFYEEAETYTIDDAQLDQVSERLVIDARVLAATPTSQRMVLAAMLSTPDLTIDWRTSAQEGVVRPEPGPCAAFMNVWPAACRRFRAMCSTLRAR